MLQQSIDNALPIKPNIWAIKNVFDPAMLEHILNRVELETGWDKVEKQENLPRECLPWKSEGLLDDIWGMINELNFVKYGFRFRTVTIWKDSAGYMISPHVDNNRVVGSMQIYLNNAPRDLGTWFEDTEVPFVKNTGYIMNNKNKPLHGMKCPVPNNVTRYSLYAWFDSI
jgi:hypothetical protein